MALSREELLSILRHAQATLREYDPALAEEMLLVDTPVDDVRPYIFEYLDRLISMISARSSHTTQQTVSRLREFVRTENLNGITGVSLVIADADRERFEGRELNLAELPDFQPVLHDLNEVRAMLLADWQERR